MPERFDQLVRMLAAVLIVGMTAGCASLTAGRGRADSSTLAELEICRQFRPVSWSQSDTDDTIRQVKANNAVGVSICRWSPK